MANPIRYLPTATGAGPWFSLDYFQSPFNVAVSVSVVSPATCTYSVEYTDDDVNNPAIATITTFTDPTLNSQTASGQSVVNRPTKFARINVAALTLSTGQVAFNIIQGMSAR